MDYLPLLRAQRDSVRRLGHRHTVVTDGASGLEFETLPAVLPDALMPAMIEGVIARLRRGGDAHLVFVDADCLIGRELDSAFTGREFDLGLTRRENDVAPINNGAMYVHAKGINSALHFFGRALALCGEHWGADQEAISAAAAPVPKVCDNGFRHGCLIEFLSMRTHGNVPKLPLKVPDSKPYVLHFKGATKDHMLEYAARFLS